MTTARLWFAGARPRTLGAAVAPVVVGTAAAHQCSGTTSWGRAVLALVVALAMQVGVNYANDYSDGVRGTDRDRKGPVRLTATGLASPRSVATAAGLAFLVAAGAGLALAALVSWWLVVVGAGSILAALGYTGGPRPYGYHGLGEVMVLAFFGFVATAGSAYVQVERVPATAWWGSLTVGLLATAILVANNVRDLDSDTQAGKRTLAVRLGSGRARSLYAVCIAGSFLAVLPSALIDAPWVLLALLAVPLALAPTRVVLRSTQAPALVGALVATARLEVVVAMLLGLGLWIS